MRTEDYLLRIKGAQTKFLANSSEKVCEAWELTQIQDPEIIFKRFVEKLIPNYFEVSISKSLLHQYLYPEDESHDIEHDIT